MLVASTIDIIALSASIFLTNVPKHKGWKTKRNKVLDTVDKKDFQYIMSNHFSFWNKKIQYVSVIINNEANVT